MFIKKTNEIVERVKSCYVADDCVQVMVPYRHGITILSQDGILLHNRKDSNYCINKYLQDSRRNQFPYSNIPMHNSRVKLVNTICYSNQLFEYNKPYIRIVDGSIVESYAIKDNDEALVINKIMPAFKRVGNKTRDELEKLLDKSSYPNYNVYFMSLDGEIFQENKLEFPSEEMIINFAKKCMQGNLDRLKEKSNVMCNSSNVVGDYLNLDSCFFDFVQNKICDFVIDDINFEIPLSKEPLLIIKTNNEEFIIESIEIFFVSHNNYKVKFYDIPVTKYTLEQLKQSAQISLTKQPKISLRLNPNITKQDLKEVKEKFEVIKSYDGGVLGKYKFDKPSEYEYEEYSVLAYEKIKKEQTGPILKKKRK